MKLRALLILVGCFALGLGASCVGLVSWLSLAPGKGAAGLALVSVWRDGTRVARAVAAANPEQAFTSERETPGTSVVLERVTAEGSVVTLTRGSFARSFLAGRDGVHGSLGGREAYLTPDDLRQAHLYTSHPRAAWSSFGPAIDVDRVLSRLARELGASADELWKKGRFRRFTVARKVLYRPIAPEAVTPVDPLTGAPLEPPEGGGELEPVGEPARGPYAAPTPVEIGRAGHDIALYLTKRVQEDGRFDRASEVRTGAASADFGWREHAWATLFLAKARYQYLEHPMGAAARRAARRLREVGTVRCGEFSCVGNGNRIDIEATALAALIYSQLASQDVGHVFREPLGELADFLRGQQRSDGAFLRYYDRAGKHPVEDGGIDATGNPLLAMVSAFRTLRRPEDFDAAQHGLDYRVRRFNPFGVLHVPSSEANTCEAAYQLWGADQNWDALDFCLRWAAFGRGEQFDPDGPEPEFTGGYATSFASPPEILPTADRVSGSVATVGMALLAGYKRQDLDGLLVQIGRGFGFLYRQQVPNQRDYLLPAGDFTGGVTCGPLDVGVRLEQAAASGSAMMEYLRLLEALGPSKRPGKKRRRHQNKGFGAAD